MTPNPPDAEYTELLSEGGTVLLDLVAAVDYLNRGHRPGLTVWDAIEEAIRWHVDTSDDIDWADVDPLRTSLATVLTDGRSTPIAPILQTALRRWIDSTGDRFNLGHRWPHPMPRRGFPPPQSQ